MLTVISFYTKEWEYKHHAENLMRDCNRLRIKHYISELPSTGSYLKNTCLKPRFILDTLKVLKSPVLWIDCDGSLNAPPVYFYDLNDDFAARRMPPQRVRTWHVGTMWFNYNDRVLKFIERWIENTGAISDESGLEKTWRECILNAVDIPPEYFRILKRKEVPKQGDVICHRISDSVEKRRELPIALARAKSGIL